MSAPPSELLVSYLIAEGVVSNDPLLDWYVTIGAMPDSKDNIVTIYDTDPLQDGRLHTSRKIIFHPGIQIRVRSRFYKPGWIKIHSILSSLEDLLQEQITLVGDPTTHLVECFNLQSGPMFMGVEEKNNRQNFTLNGFITTREL